MRRILIAISSRTSGESGVHHRGATTSGNCLVTSTSVGHSLIGPRVDPLSREPAQWRRQQSQPLRGPSGAVSDDRLVYAVCRAGESEPAPERALRDRRMDHRFVQEDVSDEMLLKNVAEGDKAAMHIMFVRHRERVFQFIRRLVRNPAIVDDLVNQVFLDVWRSANRFESRARVSTWLLSIARFKAINSLRERTHENIDQDDVLAVVDAGDAPDVVLDRKEREGILRACIDKLSPGSSGNHRPVLLS